VAVHSSLARTCGVSEGRARDLPRSSSVRVLLVSQEVPPDTAWGGIGTYVDVLSEALAAMGHAVDVLSVVDGQAASRTERDGVTVHRFALPRVPDRTGRFPESWRRILVGAAVARLVPQLPQAPDVAECPEWMAEGLGLAWGPRLPVVVRLHSSARQLFPLTGQGGGARGWDGRLAVCLEDLSARLAHVVISTKSNLAEVADPLRLDPRALHPIPYPVRLPPIQPMDDSTPPRVTFVGRLEPRKAPEVVLRAAPAVLQRVPDTRFAFIGRDVMPPGSLSSSQWLRRESERLGIGHAVEFRGQLHRDELLAELQRATVCAFPSRWESFGNVVAEASAVGRPVVVTPIAPFRELVKDQISGRIVPSDEAKTWADALIELLQDRRLAERMGRAGAEHIAAISDPSRVADLTLAAYRHARRRWQRGERVGRAPWVHRRSSEDG
jgi:glycosyltransferase involved in cell wall biosynthesis